MNICKHLFEPQLHGSILKYNLTHRVCRTARKNEHCNESTCHPAHHHYHGPWKLVAWSVKRLVRTERSFNQRQSDLQLINNAAATKRMHYVATGRQYETWTHYVTAVSLFVEHESPPSNHNSELGPGLPSRPVRDFIHEKDDGRQHHGGTV